MKLPPPHVLLQLDAIIVAQRESDGARVVATAPRIAPPKPVARNRTGEGGPKPVEMRRIGDAEWRWFGSHTDAAIDEFRAAKKQRAEQRIAYSDQNIGYRGSSSGKWSSLRHML